MNEAPLLVQATSLGKRFGGIHAVRDVDMVVRQGDMVGLIGPNGSGKTTLINMLTGHLAPTSGQIMIGGECVARLAAYGFAARGVGRTFQITQLFGRMTVLENMLVPGLTRPHSNRATVLRAAEGYLAFLGLDNLGGLQARNLSGGQQKLLELGRALMLEPRILFLDEPFAGVNPFLRDEIIGFVQKLHADGRTFVIVDHDLDAIQRLAHRLVVMSRGQKIADGPLAVVREDQGVVRAYTGA